MGRETCTELVSYRPRLSVSQTKQERPQNKETQDAERGEISAGPSS